MRIDCYDNQCLDYQLRLTDNNTDSSFEKRSIPVKSGTANKLYTCNITKRHTKPEYSKHKMIHASHMFNFMLHVGSGQNGLEQTASKGSSFYILLFMTHSSLQQPDRYSIAYIDKT